MTVVGPDARRVRRALRWPLLVVLIVLLGGLLGGLARTKVVAGELDPDAVDPAGSHALAVLLGNHGIPVHRVSTVDDAVRGSGGGTAILVAFPDRLEPGALRRLAASTPRLILIAPDLIALREVTDQVVSGVTAIPDVRDPNCAEPGAQLAGSATMGDLSYLLGPQANGYSCYDGTLVQARLASGGTLVVFGTGQPLRNEVLDQEGNAALAMNELGLGTEVGALSWLMPPVDVANSDQPAALSDLLPPWVPAAVLELLVAGLLLVLWRGRRLGPPVTEPLPVVVRAAETVHGRARLYRRGQAHDQAARALRAGALARIVPRLRLGDRPPPDAVIAATASRTGRPGAQVSGLLYGPPPLDDAGLVALADELDTLVADTLRQ